MNVLAHAGFSDYPNDTIWTLIFSPVGILVALRIVVAALLWFYMWAKFAIEVVRWFRSRQSNAAASKQAFEVIEKDGR